MRTVSCALSVSLFLSGCATHSSPRSYGDRDGYARYYDTQSGQLLRVDRDGNVFDVTCAGRNAPGKPIDVLQRYCTRGRVEFIGKLNRIGDDWDLSRYDIALETGTCEPLVPLFSGGLQKKRRSCWHRLWEVPTLALLMPPAIVFFFIYPPLGMFTIPSAPSRDAVAAAKTFLRENVCLNMSEEEFKDRIESPRSPPTGSNRVTIIHSGKEFYEIGTNNRTGLRAYFVENRFIGHSEWRVEMGWGRWPEPTREDDALLYMPCFFNESGRAKDLSFPSRMGQYIHLEGRTRREIPTGFLGAYPGAFPILNLQEGLSADQKMGPMLPPGTPIISYYKHNGQIFQARLKNEEVILPYRTFVVPPGNTIDDYIDITRRESQ